MHESHDSVLPEFHDDRWHSESMREEGGASSDQVRQLTEVVERCEREHLTDHSPCRMAGESSAVSLVRSREYQAAWDALSIVLQHLKRMNPGTVEGNELAIRYRIGDVLYQAGNLQRALSVQGPNLDMYIEATGAGSPWTLRALSSLGRTLLTQSDKEGFLEVSKDVMEAQLRQAPTAMGRSAGDGQALFFMAQCYRWIGYPEMASRIYCRVVRCCVARPRWWFFGLLALTTEVSLIPLGLVRLWLRPKEERAKVPTRLMKRRATD